MPHLQMVNAGHVYGGRADSSAPGRYDSFNGEPCLQRSIALEKAGVLFNLAALYSQAAAGEPRDSTEVPAAGRARC
jgi:hypothetical protein